MEDDFDLDLYIKEQTEKTFFNKLREKSRKLSNFVKIMLVIVSLVTAYTVFYQANRMLEIWRVHRINQTAREITELSDDFIDITRLPDNSIDITEQPDSSIDITEQPDSSIDITEQPDDSIDITEQSDNSIDVGNTVQETERRTRVFQRSVTSMPTPILMPVITHLREQFQNDDIVAFLRINDSNIDFPVVLTDNNTHYLTHDLNNQYNAAGSAFMDYDSHISPLGYNTVIYAHNMRDQSMFHDLRYYRDEEYFNTHNSISLLTLYENTLWEIFSFYETTIDFLYNATEFIDADEFLSFANLLKEKSLHPRNVEFTEDSRILTLSTCTNRNADSRYVIHAHRIR